MTDIRQTLAAWARGRMVPLETYYRFHGMLIGPSAARECCDSFARGTILFMPSSYRLGENDERGKSRAGAAATRLSRWDASGVTVSRYFLLVLLSFTGLSTLLGLTETIDARELREGEWSGLFHQPSAGDDQLLQVSKEAERYISEAHGAHSVSKSRRDCRTH
jgi:hypothetical protein